jgi:hypothetical protein
VVSGGNQLSSALYRAPTLALDNYGAGLRQVTLLAFSPSRKSFLFEAGPVQAGTATWSDPNSQRYPRTPLRLFESRKRSIDQFGQPATSLHL